MTDHLVTFDFSDENMARVQPIMEKLEEQLGIHGMLLVSMHADIESTLREILKLSLPEPDRYLSSRHEPSHNSAINLAVVTGVLSVDEAETFRKLNKLRNTAVHTGMYIPFKDAQKMLNDLLSKVDGTASVGSVRANTLTIGSVAAKLAAFLRERLARVKETRSQVLELHSSILRLVSASPMSPPVKEGGHPDLPPVIVPAAK